MNPNLETDLISINKITNIREALKALGVTDSTLGEGEKRALEEQGFLLLENLVAPRWLEDLRNAFEECWKKSQGEEEVSRKESGTRHLVDLVSKGEVFERVVAHPKLLAAVYQVLGREFKLGSLNGRDPLPGYGGQGLHADGTARAAHQPYEGVTSIWMLDEFTVENGATRLVPGTHKAGTLPPKSISQPASQHASQISVTAPAGSVLIFNLHLWHSGQNNASAGPRRALQCLFTARDRAGMHFASPEIREGLPAALLYLLGL